MWPTFGPGAGLAGAGCTAAPVVGRTGGGFCANTGVPARARHTRNARCMERSEKKGLEEVADLEVKFPARFGPAQQIRLVEAVGVVDPQRAQRRNHRHPNTRAAEQAGRVVLARTGPPPRGVVERLRL